MTCRSRGQFRCLVQSNDTLCREHYRLVLTAAEFPPTQPGQFVQLACRDLDESTEDRELEWRPGDQPELHNADLVAPTAMLRRPFSLAGRRDRSQGVELDIIHRVIGVATQWLADLEPGDVVGVLGPLGNSFELPPVGATAILVGGGVGIPPMLYLAEKVAGRAVAFSGATSRDLLPLTLFDDREDPLTPLPTVREFAQHRIPSVISTDNGSLGFRGYVTQALEAYLDAPDALPTSDLVIYTCGPEPMMKRVAEIALSRGIACQVAVERAMACGMGTCQSCCIRVRKPDRQKPPLPGSHWCYRLACTDGPIFAASELLW